MLVRLLCDHFEEECLSVPEVKAMAAEVLLKRERE